MRPNVNYKMEALRFMIKTLCQSLALVCSLAAGQLLAENKALIIGVSEYYNTNDNLPGVALDVDNMYEVVRMLGYHDKNIVTLRDSQATRDNVIEAIRDHLIAGSKPNDNLLLYFSGHGTRVYDENGDEADGIDEALVLYGASPEESFFIDDEFSSLLGQIQSNNLYVYIDACHSGSATRSMIAKPNGLGVNEYRSKFYTHKGLPKGGSDGFLTSKNLTFTNRAAEWLSFSAAQDEELAKDSDAGGIFTLGLIYHMKKALTSGNSFNHKELERRVAGYIKNKLSPDDVHTPKLSGSRELKRRKISVVPSTTTGEQGVTWSKLLQAVDKAKPISVKANRISVRLGEQVSFNIAIPQSGYLNVISVDAYDQATVLFPNRFNQDNHVKAGSISIPTPQMNFSITAQEPAGQSLTVAFVTNQPLDLYQATTEGRNSEGAIIDALVPLSAQAMRGLIATSREGAVYAGKVEVEIR